MLVYTDKTLTDLIVPTRISDGFGWDVEDVPHFIAEYKPKALPEDEAWYTAHPETWWREVGTANTNVQYDLEGIVAAGGLLQWLCNGDERCEYDDDDEEIIDDYRWEGGASAERNVAACIGEMTKDAGMDAIEMVNTIHWAMEVRNPVRFTPSIVQTILDVMEVPYSVANNGDGTYNHNWGGEPT